MRIASGLSYRVLLVGGGLRILARTLFDSDSLTSAGECGFVEALDVVRSQSPDVLLVDLTSLDALHAIERIMAERPTAILALDPGVLSREEAFRALTLGALDVVGRTAAPGPEFWQSTARRHVGLARHVRPLRRQVLEGGGVDAHSERVGQVSAQPAAETRHRISSEGEQHTPAVAATAAGPPARRVQRHRDVVRGGVDETDPPLRT